MKYLAIALLLVTSCTSQPSEAPSSTPQTKEVPSTPVEGKPAIAAPYVPEGANPCDRWKYEADKPICQGL